jgi:carbonic anhydrase/acetyltransferase-like protein (isoleucine patch superfamily)
MKQLLLSFLLVWTNVQLFAQKTVFTPTEWSNSNHEYYNRMSADRMYESANFVLYWGDIVGTNPQNASNADLRFNPQAVADTFEFIFNRFITDLKFINNAPNTNFGKYKTPVVILGTFSGGDDRTTGFAHASSYSNTIGAMFVHPTAVKDGGAISHEYAHALQMMMRIQENPGSGTALAGYDWAGPFFEGHANFMRAQRYQKWANIDGTLTRWIQTRHFMWSSNRHHYTNYNLLFHVQQTDGFDMTRRMWSESKNQEHPLEVLKRLKGFTQEQLNDYLYNYAAKEVTFDYPIQWNSEVNQNSNFGKTIRQTYQGIKNNLPRYTSREYTLLSQVSGSTDRYYVNDDWAPQDYGMNIIPLYPTCTGASKTVSVKFKGHTEVNTAQAGWRYGFVTTKPDGTVSRYSPMSSNPDGEASFVLNTATESNIYLVVFSAPKTHVNYNMDVGYPKQRRYPYELKIANAVPEGYQAASEFRKWRKTNGKLHSNGGGWVANGSNVAASAYVGPYAMVLGGTVSGNARIEGFATVQGGNVSGNAVVKDNASIYNATISNDATVSGNAWMEGGSVTNTAQIKGNAMLFAGNFGSSVVVGGDAEIGSCSTPGVYLQFPYFRNGRTNCDGKGANDASNIDINATFTLFNANQMAFTETVNCSGATLDCNGVENGTATLDACGKCIGGTTNAVSDDTDNDGVIDCLDECPNDDQKTAAGFCGCGMAEGSCGIGSDNLEYQVTLKPLSDYTSTTIALDAQRIATAFGMTQQQVKDALGTSITYYGVNPDGSLNATSTANAPGHWFNKTGHTIAWGDDAYIYSELDINTFTVNIGQYPDRSKDGDRYTIKQALQYKKNETEIATLTFIFTIAIEDELVTGVNNTSANYSATSIFPNPFNQQLVIQQKDQFTYQVLSMDGKEVLKGHAENFVEIGSSLPSGLYMLKIQGADSKVFKIYKQAQ